MTVLLKEHQRIDSPSKKSHELEHGCNHSLSCESCPLVPAKERAIAHICVVFEKLRVYKYYK